MSRFFTAVVLVTALVISLTTVRATPCPGRTQPLLVAFGDALMNGNRSTLMNLFHPQVKLRFSTVNRCGNQTAVGVEPLMNFLDNEFGASVELLWSPTLQLQSDVTAASIVHVAAFTSAINGTNSYVNRQVAVAIRSDSTWQVITEFSWIEDTSTVFANATQLKALFWGLMNTSQTAHEGQLERLYAFGLSYYPMLCGSPYPPFPINKSETMRVANQSYEGQQLDTSRVDFLLVSCDSIVASFVNVYVGRDGRKMTLQDFDFWFVDPSFRVQEWWEFGLMLRQAATPHEALPRQKGRVGINNRP